MHIKNLKSKFFISAALFVGLLSSGCSLIYEDLEPCPALLRLRFVYDCNIKWADAFAHEVTSVNVWAFDHTGRPVWSGSAAGPELASGDFFLDTPLTEGVYDFVAWCGLKDNDCFDLATYAPASKEDLKVKLRTVGQDGQAVSQNRLPGLYHAEVANVRYSADSGRPTVATVRLRLKKNTNNIRLMLQHLDGSEIDSRDFSVTITDANAEYAWDNSLLMSPAVTYLPWNTEYGVATAPGAASGRSGISTVASLLFDLSTGRLVAGSDAVLNVRRNTDGCDIIRIPLTDYLLLVKGHYGDLSDQDYLDFQDEYSMVFFIDKDSNWYLASGIYINNWAVVPPQSQNF